MPGNENKVCKLIKSLYGLKQAPKQWHQNFDEVVLSNGYLLNQANKCIYSKFDEYGKGVIICLYVDDMMIFGTDQVQVDLTKEFLSSRFSMKEMGEADGILGIRIKHESNGIAISQSHYIQKVQKKFNYFDCAPVSTPMDTSEKLMPNNSQAVSQLEYSRVSGCLMYAMTYTRSDIAFAMGKLSKYTSNPVLEGYTDASWISNTEDNSSTSGLVFLLAAGKEAEWLRNLILEIPLWSKPIAPISIRCDSAATLANAYSQMYNGKSRHLGVRHNMIHELITIGVISIEFVKDTQLPAKETWQLSSMCKAERSNVVYVLTTPIPEDGGDDPTMEQQFVESRKELWDSLDAKYMAKDASSKKFLKINMDESIQVSCIIDKLPPSWKDLKHTLKHLKEELTLVELGSHLRIEESLRVQDSDKPKSNNVAGPHYLCDLNVIPSLENKKYFVTFIDDASRFCYVSLLHTKDEALDKLKVFKTEVKLQQRSLIKRLRTESRVLRAVHSKAFRFFVIEPNDSVAINSIIKSKDVIFDENRFSSVLRPSFRIPNRTEDIGGSVVPEEVTEEVANFLVANESSKENLSTIRLLIAMASIHNLIIHQMDVKTASLNDDLDEEAPKQWHQKFDEVILSNGYLVNQADKCVYSNFDETGKEVIICLYVDDMLIFGTDQVQVDLTKEFLSSRFSMKDIGEANVILGIRIKHESNGITISQSHYIEKVLKKFNYFDCTLVSTPMDTSEKLMPNNGQVVSQLEYSRVIGCLISKVYPFKLVKLDKV
ncbi:zinc finger, CCHC-type containing protein [Tanacetum coccineum]